MIQSLPWFSGLRVHGLQLRICEHLRDSHLSNQQTSEALLI